VVEADETFSVTLSNPSTGLALGTLEATGTILADDPIVDIQMFNTTTGKVEATTPVFFTGPVAGLEKQFVHITPDNVNVSVSGDNWFIHTGSGMDAIQVHGGINVLDGGTGSNFLTGGTGDDTYFVDARALDADVWSTVTAFQAAEEATLWGINATDFVLNWYDGLGAEGATGLTLVATRDGMPNAALTLSGYSRADLDAGRLIVTFGNEPVSGSDYMWIYAAP
jgi:serralysin